MIIFSMDQFVRGYEYYINTTGDPGPCHHHLIGEKVNKRLIPWLREHKNENFFLFIHYWDPHTPYNQPQKFRTLFRHKPGDLSDLKVCKAPAGYSYVPGWGKVGKIFEPDPAKSEVNIDLYDGEIAYVDFLIGEVINELKKLELVQETIVIITSDHGEQLGQHGEYDHMKPLESVIHIPLILWAPGRFPKGKVIEGYVQQIDIAPFILSCLGIKNFPPLDGKNLLPVITENVSLREKIFVEGHQYRCIIWKKWKYIRNYFSGSEELYNLEEDPMEEINLSMKEPEQLKVMRTELNNWVKRNLGKNPDPLWEQMAKWTAVWNTYFEDESYYMKPKPTLVEGIDI